ncbi:hypothetical protein HDK64DRAFT_265016 [Phyllosticta capitalensis]
MGFSLITSRFFALEVCLYTIIGPIAARSRLSTPFPHNLSPSLSPDLAPRCLSRAQTSWPLCPPLEHTSVSLLLSLSAWRRSVCSCGNKPMLKPPRKETNYSPTVLR